MANIDSESKNEDNCWDSKTVDRFLYSSLGHMEYTVPLEVQCFSWSFRGG